MSAADIYQDWLDETSPIFLSGDFSRMPRYIQLPYRHKSPDDDFIIETEADFLKGASAFCQMLEAYGVNQFIPLVIEARYLSDHYLEGVHRVHILRNAHPVFPSYLDRIVLKRDDAGAWRAAELESAIPIRSWPGHFFPGQHDEVDFRGFSTEDIRSQSVDAQAIYQTYLDQIAATVADADFDAYCDLHNFPYTAHGAHTDQLIESPDDLRPFYEVLRRCHNGEVGDRIERISTKAEFISRDRICGYHEGTVFLGNTVTVPTVYSRIILKRTGTAWRLRSCSNSIDNRSYPFSMYKPGGTLRTHLEIKQRTKTWQTSN